VALGYSKKRIGNAPAAFSISSKDCNKERSQRNTTWTGTAMVEVFQGTRENPGGFPIFALRYKILHTTC
jgi:hypothetical protein